MKYEINIGSREALAPNGEKYFLDQVVFAIRPKENVLHEILFEIQQKIAGNADLHQPGLLRYKDFIRHGDGFFLVRAYPEPELRSFIPRDLEDACRGLLRLLEIIRECHERDEVIGGLSRGVLKRDLQGELYLQDPILMNKLNTWLADPEYRYDKPPEVIRGEIWQPESDVYDWAVIAYQWLTGKHPFTAANEADRIAQVLRGKVIAPKDYQPSLSPDLNQWILKALAVSPTERPTLDTLIEGLSKLLMEKTFAVPTSEAEAYQVKADRSLKKHQTREKSWLWLRRHGMVSLTVAAVVIAGYLMILGFQAKPVITEKNSPMEVVDYYFESVRTTNVALMIETLYRAENNLEDMVSNIHVMNLQGATETSADRKLKIEFDQLKAKTLTESDRMCRYLIRYNFHVKMGNKIQYLEREDIFTLKPIKKVWRITGIKINHQKHWEVDLPDRDAGVK